VTQLLPAAGDYQGTSVVVNGVSGRYFAPGSFTAEGQPSTSGILVFTENDYSYSVTLFDKSNTKARVITAMSFALSHLA
jgi:hypothetical protein